METLSAVDAIKILHTKKIPLFTLNDFAGMFSISNRQTLYKKVQRLENKKIIQKLVKGKYLFLLRSVNDFTIANFLYQPSYISLDSALSFYGIITGFPYQITSMTVQKSRQFSIEQREFNYSQISSDLFWGWEKDNDFLIAKKEKALLDYLYFSLKGLRNLDLEEIDTTEIDKDLLFSFAKKFRNIQILKLVAKLKI